MRIALLWCAGAAFAIQIPPHMDKVWSSYEDKMKVAPFYFKGAAPNIQRAHTRAAACAITILKSHANAPFAGSRTNDAAIELKHNLGVLTSGKDLMILESSVAPVESLTDYNELTEDPKLLESTVMVKLNGGLGTGMGLEKAKSLLDLKDGMTFLDFIAKQVLDMREKSKVELAFMLMNSFATSADTLEHLSKYKTLQSEGLPLEFVQNKAPKVTEADLTPLGVRPSRSASGALPATATCTAVALVPSTRYR